MPDPSAPLFDHLDTVVLRVADCEAAVAWYGAALGLSPVFVDAAEGLAVLGLQGCALTLWQHKPAATAAAAEAASASAFPIFATGDAAAARTALEARGVRVGPLVEGDGVRFFLFFDLDGNRLEACQPMSG